MKLTSEKHFGEAYGRLTEDERYDVDIALAHVRHGKKTRGLNEEKIRTACDEPVWSYRVNDDIRIIAYKWRPSEILLLDVGHHQDVYRRADRLKIVANSFESLPEIQEVTVVKQIKAVEYAVKPYGFATIDDCKLLKIGVGNDLLSELKSVCDEDSLERFIEAHGVGDDLSRMLIDLAEDPSSVDRVIRNLERKSAAEILDKDSFSRANYILLTPEVEERFYGGKLENWQVYLHPNQLAAVQIEAEGPVMVRGPAGTGKTVVAIHRVKWLLENKFKHGERILFTTFTKTLVEDVSAMLRQILDEYQMKRVDVRTVDSLILDLWKKEVGKGKMVYEKDSRLKPIDDYIDELLKGKKVFRDAQFIKRELLRVLFEYPVVTLDEYKRVQRPKAYGLVQLKERETLWPILEKALLFCLVLGRENKVYPRPYAINLTAKAIRDHGQLWSSGYAAVIVDEVQDLGASEYRFLAAYTGNTVDDPKPNSLFLAGDGHQRIYGRCGRLRDCGISVPGARSLSLTYCYRSTGLIRQYAERVIRGVAVADPDGERQKLEGGVSLCEGVEPKEAFFTGGDAGYDSMNDCIVSEIRAWMGIGSKKYSDYAVLLREAGYGLHKECYLWRTVEALKKRGVPAVMVTNDKSLSGEDAVRVMTMHRAKGLQFYGVVVETNHWPHKAKNADDSERAGELEQEKCLFYMSLMRATTRVLVTGVGKRPKALNCVDEELDLG